MQLTLKVWRQKSRDDKGNFVIYELNNVDEHASFLEMFDVLNDGLIAEGQDPVAFDHDCREGICGSCSMVINGRPHGPLKATAIFQLHIRHFKVGETITIDP